MSLGEASQDKVSQPTHFTLVLFPLLLSLYRLPPLLPTSRIYNSLSRVCSWFTTLDRRFTSQCFEGQLATHPLTKTVVTHRKARRVKDAGKHTHDLWRSIPGTCRKFRVRVYLTLHIHHTKCHEQNVWINTPTDVRTAHYTH